MNTAELPPIMFIIFGGNFFILATGDLYMLSKDEFLKNINELYDAYISANDRLSRLERQNNDSEATIARLESQNTALEANIARLISLNSALRKEVSTQRENLAALRAEKDREISALNAEITQANEAHEAENLSLREQITAQNSELSQLRRQIAEGIEPGHIPALSPLQPEFLRIEDHGSTGKPDEANFWRNFFGQFPATGRNDRYQFYIGYLYERLGWRVTYREKDKRIFCIRGSKIIVVSTEDSVNISHNTMYALIGSALKCKMDNPGFDVSALCVTSQTLTQGADIAAKIFKVSAKIHFPFANFPYVKCKVLDDRKVHYTPLDKEYFTTQINTANGDMFAPDVACAAANGFNP